MTIRPLFIISALVLVFAACKKDEKIEIHDSSIIIDTVSSPLVNVTMLHPAQSLGYQSGTLTFTIDVNNDTKPDFELINSYNTACLGADYTKRTRIRALNPESSVLCDSSYRISTFKLGTGLDNVKTYDSLFPRINHLKGKLEAKGNFSKANIFVTQSSATVCANPTAPVYTYDEAWNKVDKSFIGVKCDGSLGWIMIGLPNNLVVYGYALSK